MSTGDFIRHRCFSRVGLLGNPSDGYHGKVVSFALQNFSAEVTITAARTIHIIYNPIEDGHSHSTLADLSRSVTAQGYSGGLQIILAACNVFWRHCQSNSITLPSRGFTMSYDTNIPRQCGLSGSSAIVIAALKCLVDFYEVSDRIGKQDLPGLALSAEGELGITAGLQDRVIQVFGGVLFMDFDQRHITDIAGRRYEALEPGSLPTLYVVYSANPSNSGRVHSDVKKRWLAGDADVRRGMEKIAELARLGRLAIEAQDWGELGRLMDSNFDARRRIFGDAVLGDLNIKMVTELRRAGGSTKFCGSGGAVVVLPRDEAAVHAMTSLCESEGWMMIKAEIADPT